MAIRSCFKTSPRSTRLLLRKKNPRSLYFLLRRISFLHSLSSQTTEDAEPKTSPSPMRLGVRPSGFFLTRKQNPKTLERWWGSRTYLPGKTCENSLERTCFLLPSPGRCFWRWKGMWRGVSCKDGHGASFPVKRETIGRENETERYFSQHVWSYLSIGRGGDRGKAFSLISYPVVTTMILFCVIWKIRSSS